MHQKLINGNTPISHPKKKTYNPVIHHRKSIRLKGYDYAQAGLYFITICCQDRMHRFGHIVGDDLLGHAEMKLNEYGKIAHNEWEKLSERFHNFELDVFQIMPNHMHGIIRLNEISAGAGFNPAPNKSIMNLDYGQPRGIAPTVGDIVGAYKSLVSNGCLSIYKSKNQIMDKLWQRNYHERIIRDDRSYHRVSEYITNNPAKWAADKFYKNQNNRYK